MGKEYKGVSKFLSLVLRHKPEEIGLQLDENGWARVDELLAKVSASGNTLDMATLEAIVESNDKKRFAFNHDKTQIRANQGHSITVDLALQPVVPPAILYHGTAEQNIESIMASGLNKGNRHHVHLSENRQTATAVGQRYGKPVLLTIDAAAMHQAGQLFYVSDNGVWLTDAVAPQYISR